MPNHSIYEEKKALLFLWEGGKPFFLFGREGKWRAPLYHYWHLSVVPSSSSSLAIPSPQKPLLFFSHSTPSFPPQSLRRGGALIIKLLLLFSPHPLLDIIGVSAGEREIEVERRVMVWGGGRAKLRCWEIAESILWRNLFRSLGNKSLHQIIEFYFFTEKLLQKKNSLAKLGGMWGVFFVLNDCWCFPPLRLPKTPPSLPQKAF